MPRISYRPGRRRSWTCSPSNTGSRSRAMRPPSRRLTSRRSTSRGWAAGASRSAGRRLQRSCARGRCSAAQGRTFARVASACRRKSVRSSRRKAVRWDGSRVRSARSRNARADAGSSREGPRGEAREVVGFLPRQVDPFGGHRDQLVQRGPEGLEVTPLEDRVDRLHPLDERPPGVGSHDGKQSPARLILCGSLMSSDRVGRAEWNDGRQSRHRDRRDGLSRVLRVQGLRGRRPSLFRA